MGRLRVATVPDRHPYIQATLPPQAEHLSFVGVGGPWAPSPLLAIDGLAQRLVGVDVVHLHFGYESMTPAQLAKWLDTVSRAGSALVLTVHDLRNPHQADPSLQQALLSLLVPAAAEVITLTNGAAAQLQQYWGRAATVLAHPSLLGDEVLPPRPEPARRVGIHLKSLRANIVDPGRVVGAAATAVWAHGGTLQVDVHDEVLDSAGMADVRALAQAGRIQLRSHPRFTDRELLAYLSELDVSLLGYRFGTHSGWLELCHDLGTAAVVPDCGFFAEQWLQAHVYTNNEILGLDDGSLAAAIGNALDSPRPRPADPAWRAGQLATVREAHAVIYRRAVLSTRMKSAVSTG